MEHYGPLRTVMEYKEYYDIVWHNSVYYISRVSPSLSWHTMRIYIYIYTHTSYSRPWGLMIDNAAIIDIYVCMYTYIIVHKWCTYIYIHIYIYIVRIYTYVYMYMCMMGFNAQMDQERVFSFLNRRIKAARTLNQATFGVSLGS